MLYHTVHIIIHQQQDNKWILLHNNILDKTSHIITQQCCRAYGVWKEKVRWGRTLAYCSAALYCMTHR